MNKPLPQEWIGTTIHFRGEAFIVHEVIDADSARPQLVLKSGSKAIQPDQWGDARRRVPETITIAVYAEDQPETAEPRTLNPELKF